MRRDCGKGAHIFARSGCGSSGNNFTLVMRGNRRLCAEAPLRPWERRRKSIDRRFPRGPLILPSIRGTGRAVSVRPSVQQNSLLAVRMSLSTIRPLNCLSLSTQRANANKGELEIGRSGDGRAGGRARDRMSATAAGGRENENALNDGSV